MTNNLAIVKAINKQGKAQDQLLMDIFKSGNSKEQILEAKRIYISVRGATSWKIFEKNVKFFLTQTAYVASSDDERKSFVALNDTEARHWVINHLDTSKEWSITEGC